ncbi:MAG TPA: helix-turn-helix domain-containing protein [Streptosporangiaceae bacterium]|nr:helix-turn-helix domain-containing protein [Streptosporangiaceae bacterium]
MNEPTRATALGAAPPLEAAPGRGRSRDRARARDRDRSRGLSPARGEAPARRRAGGEFPRGGTRERIQSIALELFAEQGYEKTSLREIAERLGVTKAALYYHFRSKEDIVRSFIEDYRAELEQVIAWGASQPRTPGTRAEILRRYAGIVSEQLAVIRFMEQNQAAMHTLMSDSGARKKMFRDQFMSLCDLLAPPGAPLADRVRAITAVITIGMSPMILQREASSPEDLNEAVLDVARELADANLP